jgi:4-diphosphocytidyl-2-C-methyl-D-erythritol kinase
MKEFLVQSPIKINLTLRVTGRNAQGYHSLGSGVLKFPRGETLRFLEPSPEELPFESDQVETRNYPIERINILLRALEVLRRKSPPFPFQNIIIEKNSPPGTGVGGGSGNLAAFLAWMYRRYNITLEDEEIALLGADVPFLHSPYRGAFLTGIGEKIEPIHMDLDCVVILCFPEWSSQTAKAYRDLDEKESQGSLSWSSEAFAREEMFSLMRKLRKGEVHGLLPNDFLEVLPFQEAYVAFFSLASSEGALAWGVSGSGSSMYVLYPRRERGKPQNIHTFLEGIAAFPWIQKTLYLESW